MQLKITTPMSSVATSPINSEPKTSTLDIGEDIHATLKEYEPEHGRCLVGRVPQHAEHY